MRLLDRALNTRKLVVKYNSPQYIFISCQRKIQIHFRIYFFSQIFTRVHIQLEIPIQSRLLDKYITHLYIGDVFNSKLHLSFYTAQLLNRSVVTSTGLTYKVTTRPVGCGVDAVFDTKKKKRKLTEIRQSKPSSHTLQVCVCVCVFRPQGLEPFLLPDNKVPAFGFEQRK